MTRAKVRLGQVREGIAKAEGRIDEIVTNDTIYPTIHRPIGEFIALEPRIVRATNRDVLSRLVYQRAYPNGISLF